MSSVGGSRAWFGCRIRDMLFTMISRQILAKLTLSRVRQRRCARGLPGYEFDESGDDAVELVV